MALKMQQQYQLEIPQFNTLLSPCDNDPCDNDQGEDQVLINYFDVSWISEFVEKCLEDSPLKSDQTITKEVIYYNLKRNRISRFLNYQIFKIM